MFHEVIYPGGLDVTGRILVDRQSFEMCLSASDLCRFVVPQIIREQAALSFDDEIKAFLAIHLHENRPIGIVGSKRRRHFEPAGELGVNLHGLVLFELFGESALDRTSVVQGKSVSVRVDLGGRRIIKKKQKAHTACNRYYRQTQR